MRFANEVLSHQVPVNEVLAVFDDSITYLHFLLGGWGGQPPSRWGRACQTSLVLMRFANEVMRFAKEDIGSCKEGRAT